MATDSVTTAVSRQAGWSVAMGVLTAIAGIFMIVYPVATATVSTVFFGAALIVSAVAQVIFAFTSGSAGNFFLKLVLGILYGIAGVLLVVFPQAGVVNLTGVLGVMLIAEGVVEMIIFFATPELSGRGWVFVSAISSLLLGILILAGWPASSVWAIGTLVGTGVLINGITRVVLSGAVHHEARAMTPRAA